MRLSPRPSWAFAILFVLAGCTSYEPAPLRPLELLAALERARLVEASPALPAGLGPFTAADGLTLVEAAAVGVQLNPRLGALRREVGVAEAQLVEAGLLPDIELGWGAMDPTGLILAEGRADAAAWISGAWLSWPVPRPDEIDAREGVARAEVGAARARVAAAEWTLVRDVQLAYVRLLAAEARVAQVAELTQIAARTLDYFRRARALGAATALDENLAAVAASALGADAIQAEADARRARHELNALLGLPPDEPYPLQSSLDAAARADDPPRAPGALVAQALELRPDVRELLAAYERAEQALRLEVAQQWPQLTIGTGIGITLPFLSRFNQPAIRAAERAREAAGRRVHAAVQEVRAEVHAALLETRAAEQLHRLLHEELEPGLERSVRLTERAFAAREVTPLQILTTQQQVIEGRARALAAQERLAAARIRLAAATGRLLPELWAGPEPGAAVDEDGGPR